MPAPGASSAALPALSAERKVGWSDAPVGAETRGNSGGNIGGGGVGSDSFLTGAPASELPVLEDYNEDRLSLEEKVVERKPADLAPKQPVEPDSAEEVVASSTHTAGYTGSELSGKPEKKDDRGEGEDMGEEAAKSDEPDVLPEERVSGGSLRRLRPSQLSTISEASS